MTFTVLPAVDVADGRAVRLAADEADVTTIDPLEAALAWQAAGAEWIHLVDLDAAYGRGSNADLLASIVGALDIDVQLSGGIRDDESLTRALDTGCARAVVGTAGLGDPGWCAGVIGAHGDRIAFGLDVRVVDRPDGSVQHSLAARGAPAVRRDLWDTLGRLERDGCARYIVTDVSRDGMLLGPDIELYRAVADASAAPVIASGGVSEIRDLVMLAELAADGANIDGSIVGKALHAGRFTLSDALQSVRQLGVTRRP